MKIQRKRYVVMRNNRTEIWGGGNRNFHFNPVNDIGDFAIKTYRSLKQAESSCSCYYYRGNDIEYVPIIETFESVEE